MNIGDAVRKRIYEIIEEQNLTVNKLGTICGITQSTLKNILSGRNNATVATVKKICDGMNITIVDFFNRYYFLELDQEIE